MTWTLRATTVGVLVGVYQFNTNDIGASPPRSLHFFSSAHIGATKV